MKIETNIQEINQATSKTDTKDKTVKNTKEEVINSSKQALNKAILDSQLSISLSSGNNSLSLVYKSAIDHINELLAPDFGENAIQNAASSNVDVSPEATADRIVSLSTAFFATYQKQHPEKDLDTALKDFTNLISGGIDKGFAEARNILSGLSVLNGGIASNIDKTYDLVQSGLKSFIDNYPRPDSPAATE